MLKLTGVLAYEATCMAGSGKRPFPLFSGNAAPFSGNVLPGLPTTRTRHTATKKLTPRPQIWGAVPAYSTNNPLPCWAAYRLSRLLRRKQFSMEDGSCQPPARRTHKRHILGSLKRLFQIPVHGKQDHPLAGAAAHICVQADERRAGNLLHHLGQQRP